MVAVAGNVQGPDPCGAQTRRGGARQRDEGAGGGLAAE